MNWVIGYVGNWVTVTIERSAARQETAAAISHLINHAFQVEAWFVEGARTSPPEVLTLLHSPSSAFFVAVEDGRIIACVYADQVAPDLGYIGLLAVEPGHAGAGLGRRLMARAEEHLRALGCASVEITVVDLRVELFPFYERLGYRRTGETFAFPRPVMHPCHLVVMRKPLAVLS